MIKNARTTQDILIAEYTLGLLNAREKAEIQKVLGADPDAAQNALRWEKELLGLVDALPRSHPPARLLDQILDALDLPRDAAKEHTEQTEPAQTTSMATSAGLEKPDERLNPNGHVDLEAAQKPHGIPAPAATSNQSTNSSHVPFADNEPHSGKRLNKTVWLGGGAVALSLTGILALAFLPRTPVEPPVTIIEVAPTKAAILQAPGQSSTPGWVVTIDPGGNVLLTPKVHSEIPADASVQLWTYNKTIPQPRSLGLVDPNQPIAVPATLMGEIGEDQFFEMTQEPEGGSRAPEPSGPVLFIGRVVTFGE